MVNFIEFNLRENLSGKDLKKKKQYFQSNTSYFRNKNTHFVFQL